jgi:deoxyribodipyrimidine photo-lyase
MKIPRAGSDREASAQVLAAALRGCYLEEAHAPGPSPLRGGRQAALERLAAWNPRGYASRRNTLTSAGGLVSRLSPYLRHGVISLREAAHDALIKAGRGEDTRKFWAELGWRQFWQLVRKARGRAIESDLEAPKVPLGRTEALPDDIRRGETGLACMDAFVRELVTEGWLHNHARLWFAAYVIHFRKVDWRAGARFFYQHLLDGDPASNLLSWQWVASTFSAKPYIFNRDNLERHTGGQYCRQCTARCPFDASYDELHQRLFHASPPRA